MKFRWNIAIAVTVGLLLWAVNCLGQADSISIQPTEDAPTTEGRVIAPIKPTGPDATILGTDVERPESLSVDRNDIPREVKARLELFKKYSEAWLARQEELRKQLLTTTDADRAKIRELILAEQEKFRRRWLELSRERRQELKTRKEELKQKLEDQREVIDSAIQDARQQAIDAARETKEEIIDRRGIDGD